MKKTFYLNSEFETKSVSDNQLKIAGYANTVDRDRTDDIVLPSAWAKGIDNYRRNPILLYQHQHDKPIGKVNKITVDKKGIYVDAIISDAAEKNYGVVSLIKDNVLKSFSVGFRVKEMKYDKKTDSNMITDLELLEISVVSVPANQNSLFSISKSFETVDEYKAFCTEIKGSINAGITELSDHYHTFEVDESGKGITTYTSIGQAHIHKIVDFSIQESNGHAHTIKECIDMGTDQEIEDNSDKPFEMAVEVIVELPDSIEKTTLEDIETKENKAVSEEQIENSEKDKIADPYEPIPFINLLSYETSKIKNKDVVKIDGKRYTVIKVATSESPNFIFKDLDNNNVVSITAEAIGIINPWDLNTKYDINIKNLEDISIDEKIKEEYLDTVNLSTEDLLNLKDNEVVKTNDINQDRLNNTLHLLTTEKWANSDYKLAFKHLELIDELKELKSEQAKTALKILGYEEKEMATDIAGEILTLPTNTANISEDKIMDKETTVETQKAVEAEEQVTVVKSITVSEPKVTELVEKTGEAIVKGDNQDVINELKAEMAKYKDQLSALTTSKMIFKESTAKEQFSQKDIANAYLLAMATGKNVYDTKAGSRMKAVTTVDSFISNFSKDLYAELEQELVIAPMFKRIPVDAKTFRVPVADEDTDGDVAQFANGTYATGIGDATNVPTSNQNTMSAVEFTPHKFMATTHIAKDEQEDTIFPLIDFLRSAAMTRLGRAIDKAILRGDGSLSGFTASPTNAISVGTGYASVLKGICKLAADASLTVSTGASTAATPTNIASARALLGKYGLRLGDNLVYLTSTEGYNELVQSQDFRTVDTFGPQATYLTGTLGAIYGIPVKISEFLDAKGSSNNQIGALVYKPGFLIGERRGIEVESEYDPRRQVTAVYMSTRFDFHALSTVAAAALSSRYSMAVVLKSA